jgi:hypothetical protein
MHMFMYGLGCGVPLTLVVQYLLGRLQDRDV